MLDAFKLKGFDLEPVYAEWKDGPKFTGDPKRDKPVDEWLEEIKAGCKARGVPKECWHKVGQHFMGDKARARYVLDRYPLRTTSLKFILAGSTSSRPSWPR